MPRDTPIKFYHLRSLLTKTDYSTKEPNSDKTVKKKFEPYTFPKGSFVCIVMDKKTQHDKDLIMTYINERFYNISEVEINYWVLLYKKHFSLAMELANNEFERVSIFVSRMRTITGVDATLDINDTKLLELMLNPLTI